MTLVVTVLLTIGLSRHSEQDLAQHAHDRFLFLAGNAKDVLVGRMEDYEHFLRGGAALFAASDNVTREQWRAYVEAVEVDKYLPGIQGMGFAIMLPAAAKDDHERAVRAEGFPDYAIHPPGEREPLSSIVFLEPFTGRNLRAFGYDMYSEPVRRKAMQRARDTGLPALSGQVRLIQETGVRVQPGFLMYLPVYRNGMPSDGLAARRAALHGFVYSPFRSVDLMYEIFERPARDVEIEVFDGSVAPENLLFASADSARSAKYATDMELEIGGQLWLARFRSSRGFEQARASAQPTIILLGGLALDMLLFSVLYMNAQHRQRMRDAATELEQSRDSYRTLVENIPGSVFRSRIGSSWRVQHVSVGIETLTGEPRDRYLSGEIAYDELILADDRPKVQKAIADAIANRTTYRIEYRIQTTDGRIRWVGESGRASYDQTGSPQWLDGVILDIDDRKKAEIAIRELAFNDPLTGLPNRRLLLDRLEHQLAISSRTGRPGALLFLDMDNFKAINDTLGHSIGDLLLIEVAHRLRANVRESDTVARLGGDEFVVMLDDLGGPSDDASALAADVANKILEELNRPYKLREHVCTSTPSIGIALFYGHEAGPDRLLRRADQAMYKAKSAGRNRVEFYA